MCMYMTNLKDISDALSPWLYFLVLGVKIHAFLSCNYFTSDESQVEQTSASLSSLELRAEVEEGERQS